MKTNTIESYPFNWINNVDRLMKWLIYFAAPPEIIQPNETFTVRKYQSTVLECSAIGIPQPYIIWKEYYYYYRHYYYIRSLRNSSSHIISDSVVNDKYITDNGTTFIHVTSYLIISEVTDIKTYICEATNVLGTTRRDLLLIVYGNPAWNI